LHDLNARGQLSENSDRLPVVGGHCSAMHNSKGAYRRFAVVEMRGEAHELSLLLFGFDVPDRDEGFRLQLGEAAALLEPCHRESRKYLLFSHVAWGHDLVG